MPSSIALGWHADVGDDHAGALALHRRQQRVPVLAHGDQVDPRVTRQDLAHRLAHEVTVVGERDPYALPLRSRGWHALTSASHARARGARQGCALRGRHVPAPTARYTGAPHPHRRAGLIGPRPPRCQPWEAASTTEGVTLPTSLSSTAWKVRGDPDCHPRHPLLGRCHHRPARAGSPPALVGGGDVAHRYSDPARLRHAHLLHHSPHPPQEQAVMQAADPRPRRRSAMLSGI